MKKLRKIDLIIIGTIALLFILLVSCQQKKGSELPPPPPPLPTEGMESITGGVIFELATGTLPGWAASPGFEDCITYLNYDLSEGVEKTLDPSACGTPEICLWDKSYYLENVGLPSANWEPTTGISTITSTQGWLCFTSEETIKYPITFTQEENYVLQYFCKKDGNTWACPNSGEQKWILETTIIEGISAGLAGNIKTATGWILISSNSTEATYYNNGVYITVTIEQLTQTEIITRIQTDFTKQDWDATDCYFSNTGVDKLCWSTVDDELICFDTNNVPTGMIEEYAINYTPDCDIVDLAFPAVVITPNATSPPVGYCGNKKVEPALGENCEPNDYMEAVEGNDYYVCIASTGNLDLTGKTQTELEALSIYGTVNGIPYVKLYDTQCKSNDCECVIPGTDITVDIDNYITPPTGAICGDGEMNAAIEQCDGVITPGGGWLVLQNTCAANEDCGQPGTAKACQCISPGVCGNRVVEPGRGENCEPPDYMEGTELVCVKDINLAGLNVSMYTDTELGTLPGFGADPYGVSYEKLYNTRCSPLSCQCEQVGDTKLGDYVKGTPPPGGGIGGGGNGNGDGEGEGGGLGEGGNGNGDGEGDVAGQAIRFALPETKPINASNLLILIIAAISIMAVTIFVILGIKRH